MNKENIEETVSFKPQYNEAGLIPCITVNATDNSVLMMAWMNEEALEKTLQSGEMHYFSRSRNELWHKGASSGAVQKLVEMRIDCDQDCLLARVEVTGNPENTCHTGRESCFYRLVKGEKKSVKLEKL